MKRTAFNLIVWTAAGSLVFLTVRELPIAEMGLKLAEISPSAWFILFIINVAILFLAAARWKVLANIFNAELSLVDLFKIRQAGSTISFVTPGPQFGGEPLQVYWLHQKYDQAGRKSTLGCQKTNFSIQAGSPKPMSPGPWALGPGPWAPSPWA